MSINDLQPSTADSFAEQCAKRAPFVFPFIHNSVDGSELQATGLTLREFFVGMSLMGSHDSSEYPRAVAEMAVAIADATIRALYPEQDGDA